MDKTSIEKITEICKKLLSHQHKEYRNGFLDAFEAMRKILGEIENIAEESVDENGLICLVDDKDELEEEEGDLTGKVCWACGKPATHVWKIATHVWKIAEKTYYCDDCWEYREDYVEDIRENEKIEFQQV